ncbi:glucose dehydrogenase [FAD, quinone]-like [Contarinia nasturtii]|uniref:glucose dehydrogenase [FAD, quinone]-like n=1 Tax=Contarinia nasturtii TaxID=265458 RepID=UPI0012D4558B|nr:glucose dehydrogenase [FAD, quinone]-like [Contarinia nasturtii]
MFGNLAFLAFLLSVFCESDAIAQFLFDHGTIKDTVFFDQQYSFIIVGAGSAGCVLANRLSENPEWKVLLLEVGDKESELITDIPVAAVTAMFTKYNWRYQTEKEKNACLLMDGGVCQWPKGKALGGTSVINFMVYNRGHKSDFDGWAAAGNNGWSYRDVLPYFRKLERIDIEELKSSKYRGRKGNVNVQYPAYRSKLLDAFIDAGKEFGYEETDPNGDKMLGFSQVQATTRDGKRWSAAKAYLRPVAKRKNLFVSTRTWVTRVLIDPQTKVAYGVEFWKDRQRYRINATKEVILSAGVIASPQILMLSGVGPTKDLNALQIPVIQDLRVGYNLQDHIILNGLAFLVNESITVSETSADGLSAFFKYYVFHSGPFTLPGGAEGLAFVKTPNSTLANDYPDIEIVFGPGAANGIFTAPMLRGFGMPEKFTEQVYRGIVGLPAFSLIPVLLQPKSRGRLSLKSKNPFQPPKMEPNYLSHSDDLNTLVKGVKLVHKLGESTSFQKYGSRLNRQPFPGCEKYVFGSNDYWGCCIKSYTLSLQHQVGTCKMGPSTDVDAVVNPQLQLYGIDRLRVVDASIIPTIPAAHTNAVVFMIGEKAADLIKNMWSS